MGLVNVRYLGLAGTKIDNDSVAKLCCALRQLEELNLSRCVNVDSDALLFLQGPLRVSAAQLKCNPSPRHIHAPPCVQYTTELPHLHTLHLNETGVSDLTSFRAFPGSSSVARPATVQCELSLTLQRVCVFPRGGAVAVEQ